MSAGFKTRTAHTQTCPNFEWNLGPVYRDNWHIIHTKMVIIGPLIAPEEGLVKKLENVRMKINQIQMNTGTLYITEKYALPRAVSAI